MTLQYRRPPRRLLTLATALTLGLASMLPSLSPAHAAAVTGNSTARGAGQSSTGSPDAITASGITSTGWLGTLPYRFPGNDGQRHTVTWDKYSYMVDGERLNIWSGEIHYWRLPSPQHWRDIFQKMKAAGFNAVSLYFFWGYHQSAPDASLDFTGIRNVDLLLRMAAEEGLYVIARPGPYINAEISMGGMPAWQTNNATTTRSDRDDTNWEQQRAWLRGINRILARHQVTNGGGSVLMYQVENEESSDAEPYESYLTRLVKVARADGITVPIFHNDPAPGKNWAYSMDRTGLDTYSYDEYPVLFDCAATRNELVDHGADVDRAFAAAHDSPHFIAEGQGGAFTAYGAAFDSTKCADFVDGTFYRQWIALNNGHGVTAFNYYMIFGGTNWGWTGSPRNGFTSYDYGASITEDRNLRDKLSVQKENGYFYRAFPQLVMMDSASAPTLTHHWGGKITGYRRVAAGMRDLSMSGHGSQYLAFRLADSNDLTLTKFTTTLSVPNPAGHAVTFPRVPQEGQLILHGRDALQIPVDFTIGDWGAYYSTGQLFYNGHLSGRSFALVTGTAGDRGEIVLDAPHRPRVRSSDTSVTSTWDSDTHQLRINYDWGVPYDITVTMRGQTPLTLRVADRQSLIRTWSPHNWLNGRMHGMLVENADLVRGVFYQGSTAHLTGSTRAPQNITLWLPAGITHATWNGQPLPLHRVRQGGTHYQATLPGPAAVTLPTLTWVKHEESYEANPAYDDSYWRTADLTHTRNLRQGPGLLQRVVLDANAYGYHEGDVWYRAHYTADTDDPTIWIKAFGAQGSNFLVWMNGTYLGAAPGIAGGRADLDSPQLVVRAPGAHGKDTPKEATFRVPAGTVKAGEPVVLSILLRNNGQREDWESKGRNLHGMGVLDAHLGSRGPVTWKIRGAARRLHPADPIRGIYNNGGLHGERAGWYLPDFPTHGWEPTSTMHAARAGVTWYRTTFALHTPHNQDVMLQLAVASQRYQQGRSDKSRTVMFVNGWNIGTWVGNVGPQTSFTIPAGFLNRNGNNDIAVAVTAEGPDYGPDDMQLRLVGNWLGAVPWEENAAPSYPDLQGHLRPPYPHLPEVTVQQ